MRRTLVTLIVLLTPLRALASETTPDRRGEVWGGDTHKGTRANVVIPLEMRQNNPGGSNGAGICVVSSAVTNGRYQGLSRDMEKLLALARSRPGGHSPSKLDAQIDEINPNLKRAHYLGNDTNVLDRLSRAGYPVGVTMGTGKLYGYRPIAHMVSLVHYDKQRNLAALVDNNKTEVTAWMPAEEFDRRFVMGGGGWAFVWDYPPPIVTGTATATVMVFLIYVSALGAAARRRRELRLSRGL